MTFWSVLAWGLDHWGLVLSGGVLVIAFTYIISAAVYGLWLASETRKADEQRRKLKRLQAACGLVNVLDQEYGRPPRAPGFDPRKIS